MAKDVQAGIIATVKLGPKGQIVIPKEVREMFNISPGDSLVLMAHPKRGIALQKQDLMMKIAQKILDGQGQELYPNEEVDDLDQFANKLLEENDHVRN